MKYDFKEVESKIRKFWEKEQIYRFDPKKKSKVYSIDTPPPYASAGHLHVGHALSYTQFEIIARIRRMLGDNVYFAPGFDDNGLPTEKYVEEKLGIEKSKTNRVEFRKICLEESKKVEKVYAENVFKTLGHSYDWNLLYTTIGDEAQKVSQTAFVKLVKKGDCYQSEEPVIWCPYHETALAQAEVEDLQRTTKLNYIDFDLVGENEKITIATTRPEFIPACVAIFVNPKDKKNKKFIGKEVSVPLFDYAVKVMADESVDPEFGTGTMMVCTFGDTEDIDKWKRFNLELRDVVTKQGKLNERAGKYEGMDLEKGRKSILEDLKKEKRLKKQESLQQTVGACWRCNTPVEYVIAKQWFIKTLDYKEDLIKRGREINWYPDFMRKRFENWVEGLGWDWIISRQRYYGVPIPAWYCDDCGEIILPKESELPLDPLEIKKKCPKCKKPARADEDVFDTWMTSSNTPEIALRWLEKPKQYTKLAPMSLRPQSHDIIRTWAFYTILKSHLLFGRIPWEDLVVNTYVLDPKGKGMSKSKGNAVWADELIEKYGVDAFRYWVGGAGIGSDLPFKEQELVAGNKFLVKIWNASKFVFMNLEDYDPNKNRKPKNLVETDKIFLKELNLTLRKIRKYFEEYEISKSKLEMEKFFWQDFADNYIEIVKKRVYQGSGDDKLSAQYTLYKSLLAILKMFAPITPFITEEIYQNYYGKFEKEKSIHVSGWPEEEVQEGMKSEVWSLFTDVISRIRKEKTNAKKPMNAEIVLTIDKGEFLGKGGQEKIGVPKSQFGGMIEDLKNVTNAKEIKQGKFKVEFV